MSIIYLKNKDIFKIAEEALTGKHSRSNIIIPHVCNNMNAFGAGFASDLSRYDVHIKENFHMLGQKAKLGYTQFVMSRLDDKTGSKLIIANMIAQNKLINRSNPRPLNYQALVSCMISVRDYAHSLTKSSEIKTQIFAPKFGSGLAGGNWSFIENLIEDIWTNIPVFIFSKQPLAQRNNK